MSVTVERFNIVKGENSPHSYEWLPTSSSIVAFKEKWFLLPSILRYGLLGASGCGKTTLLSCIVGRKRLNSGDIFVLGGRPGTVGSGVPGPRVGYMPQVKIFTEIKFLPWLLASVNYPFLLRIRTKHVNIDIEIHQ